MKPLILIEPFVESELTIIVPFDASDKLLAAARELQYYLRKIAGADRSVVGTKITIGSDKNSTSGPRLLLGKMLLEDVDFVELDPEAYIIRRVGDDIVLTARQDTAVSFAVYHFLEEICGVRWFWPGAFGEDIPTSSTLTIDDLDITSEPSFKMRNLGGLSGEYADSDWAKHHRLGGSIIVHGVHSWGKMIPPDKFGHTNPEYFALVGGQRQWQNFNGKHGCQLCTTNHKVIELCTEYIREFFDKHSKEYVFNISPNDGGGFCECADCLALNDSSTCTVGDMYLPCVSGQIFTFANTIAKELKKSHPDHYLIILAYNQYLDPPKIDGFKLDDNVIIQFCLHCDFDHDTKWRSKTIKILKKWSVLANVKAVYEYLVWRGNAELPRPLISLMPGALKLYHENGIELFFSQFYDDFGPSGLNYYLAAKLLWNINSDPDKIINDYYDRCFGAAAQLMKQYYDLLDVRWACAVNVCGTDYYPGSPVYYLEMFKPEVLEKLNQLLESAERVADSYVTKGRVNHFCQLFKYVESTMEALHSLRPLQEFGLFYSDEAWPSRINLDSFGAVSKFTAEWQTVPSESTPNKSVDAINVPTAIRLVDIAVEKWNERNKCVEDIKNAGIIDYWHIKYDVDHDYGNDPTQRLIELKSMLAKKA